MFGIHLLAMFILAIVGLISSLSFMLDDRDKIAEKVSSISGITLIALFAFFIFGLENCENSDWIISDTPYATEKIVALNDNNMMNGRVYLRSGYIEEDLYYQYIVQLNNGGFVSNKVKSANATLFYDTDNYRVEWYTKTKQWFYFKDEVTYVEIYIPEGSITMDYSIDLN